MGNMMDVMRKNQERKDQEATDAERPTSSKNTGKYSKLPEGAELRGGAKDYVNKKSGPIVTAISAEPTTKMAPVSKPAEAVVAVKKSDSKSMAAPVKKSSPRETSKGSRNSMADDWNAFSKGREADTAALKDITDRYGKTGTLVERSADDTAELAALKPEDFKKGGMTKRPPARPTKKVPARKFASGGTTRSSTSHRGDGCATKGHTKGRVR
jgi:hypothetical protein